jgi:urease accessory protein
VITAERTSAGADAGRAQTARLAFVRSCGRTVIETAFATSPLRLLMPGNHGSAAWVFLASLGGGFVDGDAVGVHASLAPGTTALLGTQASTKVYRSPRGCSLDMHIHVGRGAALALVPDPVVCFAGAHYRQEIRVVLEPEASVFLLDGYTSGRMACGERWAFGAYSSRTIIERAGVPLLVDATRLDPDAGPLADRMQGTNAVLSAIVIGPRFEGVRTSLMQRWSAPVVRAERTIGAISPVGDEAAVLRIASDHFATASLGLRAGFEALATVLGDDPRARKW